MTRSAPAGVTGIDLAQRWRDAALFLPHLAGCTCVGPHLVLDPGAIEADLLAYLADLYSDAGRAVLTRLIEVRMEDSEPRSSFANWLASLDAAPLGADDRARLMEDLETALASLVAARSGSGFVCE